MQSVNIFIYFGKRCSKNAFFKHTRLFIVFFLLQNSLFSQNFDTQFKAAQALAKTQRYDSAIIILSKILQKNQDNFEIRLYRARVYAWNKDFASSEAEANYIRYFQPDNREVLSLLSDIYLWSKQWDKLEEITRFTLENPPKKLSLGQGLVDSILFLKKLAYGYLEQQHFNKAIKTLEPVKDSLFTLWDYAKSKAINRTLSINQYYYHFQKQPDWTVSEIDYTHKTKLGAVIGSFNHANRFGNSGNQFMLQMYPKISKKAYAWLLTGISDKKTYPGLVYGGSIFLNVSKYTELEVGTRIFKVKDTESASILRGGIAYHKMHNRMGYNIMIIRGATASGIAHGIFYQKYFGAYDSYWRVSLSTGANAQNNLLTPQFDSFIINSLSMNTSAFYYLHRNWRIFGGVSWEQSSTKNTPNRQSRFTTNLGLALKF